MIRRSSSLDKLMLWNGIIVSEPTCQSFMSGCYGAWNTKDRSSIYSVNINTLSEVIDFRGVTWLFRFSLGIEAVQTSKGLGYVDAERIAIHVKALIMWQVLLLKRTLNYLPFTCSHLITIFLIPSTVAEYPRLPCRPRALDNLFMLLDCSQKQPDCHSWIVSFKVLAKSDEIAIGKTYRCLGSSYTRDFQVNTSVLKGRVIPR